jgi:D-alanine-D-alanine ligase-like ATP-grasp enzyme
MDKEASKDAFRALGLQAPRGVCFLPYQTIYGTAYRVSKWTDAAALTPDSQPDFSYLAERLGLPLVVKPCGAGASLGLALVDDAETFARVLHPTAQRYGPLLVEAYIASHRPDAEVEFSVCLLEGEDPLPVYEVCAPRYDTAHKIDGAVYHPISGRLAGALQAAAWAIFEYLGCRGFARVDFRVTPDEMIYPLEINTNPGLIPSVCLFPKACAEIGLSYEQMIARILTSAFQPHWRAVPSMAAQDAPPFPEAFRRLLPDLPAELQPPGFYQSTDCPQAQPISLATYHC